jgi:hypothetical protein
LEPVARRDENNNAQLRSREILLELKVLIGGQEDFETRVRGALQKISILEASPTLLLDRADIVAG